MLAMRPRAFFLLLILAAPPGAVCAPGMAPPAAAAAIPVDPDAALADARGAYRDAPVAERIDLYVDSGLAERRETALIRFDHPRALALELGPLRVWAGVENSRAVVRAVHALDAAHVFEHRRDDADVLAALTEALPPIALPQLALVWSEAAPLRDLTAFTRNLAWTSATLESDHEPPVAVVTGASPDSRAVLILDAATSRLARAELESRAGRLRIAMDVSPVAPGDPASWRIDPGSRERVSEITDLAPAPGDVGIGARAPDLFLMTLDNQPWRLADRVGSPVAITLFRAAGAESALKLHEFAQSAAGATPRATAVAVAILSPEDRPHTERLESLRGQWGGELLWSMSARATIDRFAPGADAALIVVDSAGIVRLVETTSEDALPERLKAALRGG